MVKVKKKEKKESEKNDNEEIEKLIAEKVAQLDLPEDQKLKQQDALKKIFIQGVSPRLAMGLPQDFGAVLYAYAYNLFQGGKYEEANPILRMLAMLEPSVPRYHFALAACYHKSGDFEKAIECYFAAAMLDELNPMPFFHISDCYEKLNSPTGAVMALGGAVTRCGEEPQYTPIKMKCLIMLNKWRSSIGVPEEPIGPTASPEEAEIPSEDLDLFSQLQASVKEEQGETK